MAGKAKDWNLQFIFWYKHYYCIIFFKRKLLIDASCMLYWVLITSENFEGLTWWHVWIRSFKNLFNWKYDKSQIPIQSRMVDKGPFFRPFFRFPLNIIIICCFIYIFFIFSIAFEIKKYTLNSLWTDTSIRQTPC